ncbi:MAG: glutamate mutase L, partial [Anaerolineae bacterium]|nr:glutamate mutase L [Anaerolineae bacterium]
QERVAQIHRAQPDVIWIVGGTDGGAEEPILELVEVATWAASLQRSGRTPHILYMGNSQLRKQVADIVEGKAELHVADNVRPSVDREDLTGAQTELDNIYVRENLGVLPGVDTIESWSAVPLVPTARAFARVVEYLWHLGDPDRGVIGLDLGAANLTLAAAFDGQLSLAVRSDLGHAYCGEYVMRKRGVEAIARWLPFEMSEAEILGYFINRQTHPLTISQDVQEQWLDYAVAREAISIALEAAQPGWHPSAVAAADGKLLPFCDTILVSGGLLSHATRPGQAALAVLDALQPVGVTTIVLDSHGLAPALGNVALIKPLASVEVLDNGGFANLATVVTPVGGAKKGDTILRVRVTHGGGSSFGVEVHHGDLEVLPLLPGQQADLELKPLRRFDVGFGPGRSGKRRVNGGLLGLVIDARGRPLQFPLDLRKRREQVKRWLWEVGG